MSLHTESPGPPRSSDGRRQPILVTGMARSATSWVGKMLEWSGQVAYINEPLSPDRAPGRSWGMLPAPVRYRYQYISADNEHEYLGAYLDTIAFRYRLGPELRVCRSVTDLLRTGKHWSVFTSGRLLRRRPLLDDPFAVLSASWFARRLGCRVIVLIRDPLAIVASRKRLGWTFDFRHLLRQEDLLRDWLEPFRGAMEEMIDRPGDLIGQSGLLWRVIYHAVAEQRDRLGGLEIIRHEDLSMDPESGFRSLFSQLGLNYSESARRAVVHSSTGGKGGQAHSWSLSGGIPARTGYRRLDSRANLSGWREVLTEAETERVRKVTSDVAARFYEPNARAADAAPRPRERQGGPSVVPGGPGRSDQ
ncbi:MAG: sulfotransferase domain-containing protein [Actinomycetota bacterium]